MPGDIEGGERRRARTDDVLAQLCHVASPPRHPLRVVQLLVKKRHRGRLHARLSLRIDEEARVEQEREGDRVDAASRARGS